MEATDVSDAYEDQSLALVWQSASGRHSGSLSKSITCVEPVVEPVCAEEKTVLEDKFIYNPSCLVNDGRPAYFKASWTPADYPASRVSWSSDNAQVHFIGGSTGAEACVWTSGSAGAYARLSLQFGDCLSSRPSFGTKIVAPKYIRLYVVPVMTEDGVPEPEFDINKMLLVERIYSQIGINFNVIYSSPLSCPDVTVDNIRVRGGATLHGRALTSDGLVAYVVPFKLGTVPAFAYGLGGTELVLGLDATGNALAHEIGHLLMLKDIYDNAATINRWRNIQPVPKVEGDTSKACFDISDWNNGSGTRYYRSGMQHAHLIQRLLMFGIDRGVGRDIPLGGLWGVESSSSGSGGTPVFGRVPVGVDNMVIPAGVEERIE